jgi:hypothetical protein
MSIIHVWGAVALLFILILTPAIVFLGSGWHVRRRDIIEGFTDEAIQSYFSTFHPQVTLEKGVFREQFNKYYRSQFGRSRFILPLLLFTCLVGLALCWSALSMPDLLQFGKVSDGEFPTLAIIAVMGAYMWILFDEITKCYSNDLSPGDIYWWCFRLAIAVPMGYSIRGILKDDVAMPVAFLLGAFPTAQLMSIARRIATRKLGFADSENRDVSELQSLQGIDVPKAEQFAAEGITTILQLAYCDPIRLTIRTGLSYSYVVDCTCQALLWIYTEKDTVILRKSGLRSAYEVLDLWLNLEEPDEKERSEEVIRDTAQALSRPETSLRNVLKQVALDPYSLFLYLSWSGATKDQLNEKQRQILGLN